MTQPRLGYPSPVDEFAPEEVALRPRDAKFGWDETPLHWMPGDPYGSHATTALNLFLPVAERWFAKLLTEALDYVRDERLREQIIGFIGQEAIHARTHDDVLVEFVRRHGIDPTPVSGPVGMGRRSVRPSDGADFQSHPAPQGADLGGLMRSARPSISPGCWGTGP